MDTELKQIVTRMTAELQTWLDKPSPVSEKLASLETQAAELKEHIGASAFNDMKKQLRQASASAQRARCREAANGIAALCRECGVVLEAKEPLKRRRDSSKTGKATARRTGA